MSQSYNLPMAETIRIWANSLSLATTQEIIIIFSSYAYLDVSVRHVCAIATSLQLVRFPHSEICGSAPICRLPAAYRSLSRPSSPLRAKASPVYPFLLSSSYPAFAQDGMLCYKCNPSVGSFVYSPYISLRTL